MKTNYCLAFIFFLFISNSTSQSCTPSIVGANVNHNVYAITTISNDLFVGGDFTSAGGVSGESQNGIQRIG